MSQQYYGQGPQQAPYGPPAEEEEYYQLPKRTNGMMIASIVVGVLCLGLLILLLVVWSVKGSVSDRLLEEMAENAKLAKETQALRAQSRDVRQKIDLLARKAAAKRASSTDSPNVPQGSAAYWKALYERAKREARGWEMAAKRSKARLDFGARMDKKAGSGSSDQTPSTGSGGGTGG